jgi:hypothetical protein
LDAFTDFIKVCVELMITIMDLLELDLLLASESGARWARSQLFVAGVLVYI